jgi:aldehyde:ferredoxin oxidoreductase
MTFGVVYLRDLYKLGFIGPGKKVECPLDFKDYGGLNFVEQFVKMISYRNDGRGNKHQFGDDIAEGFVRAAKKWGRLDGDSGDLKTGLLFFPHWGIPVHREPQAQLEWGYGTILGDRDINEHDFDRLHWDPSEAAMSGRQPHTPAEEAVKIYISKMVPFQDDPLMLDYSTENMYSTHIAKLVSWHRYYTRFWKQSALFCDWRWPDFLNLYASNKVGSTGEAEPKFFNTVTGKNFSFLDGIKLGKKIWNLDQAIWTLQGRHRDMVHFAEFVYRRPAVGTDGPVHCMPARGNGKWQYVNMLGRTINKNKFEEFKTRFYKLQGWDTTTGYPTRQTLESMNMAYVADELEKNNKLGKG